MSTINSRLDQIEGALTPKQAVIACLEQAPRFESFGEYGNWLAGLPDEQHPLSLLLSKQRIPMENWKQARTKEDPQKIKASVHRAVWQVTFLYCLCAQMTQYFECQFREITLLGLLSMESVGFALREINDPTNIERFGLFQEYFRRYASEVFALKKIIQYLQAKYLDGHPMVWRYQADQLEKAEENIGLIAATWGRVFAFLESPKNLGNRKRKDDNRRELDFDLEALEKSIDPTGMAEEIIVLAKAEALAGSEDTTVLKFLKPLLRTKAKPQNPTAETFDSMTDSGHDPSPNLKRQK